MFLADLLERRGEPIGKRVAHRDNLHTLGPIERVQHGARPAAAAADQADRDRIAAGCAGAGHRWSKGESERGSRRGPDEIAPRRSDAVLISAPPEPPSAAPSPRALSPAPPLKPLPPLPLPPPPAPPP